ncbi:hypothetical protein CDAR_370721 [Caerostris darwini]|uniref:Maturase K n=1 Tax=Caerostris darwini TaxID=1538125 RepID=A0AAV4VH39_9ARAC|nr:hypothetical protein CDAR_370721 [Caerostris darwini]
MLHSLHFLKDADFHERLSRDMVETLKFHRRVMVSIFKIKLQKINRGNRVAEMRARYLSIFFRRIASERSDKWGDREGQIFTEIPPQRVWSVFMTERGKYEGM